MTITVLEPDYNEDSSQRAGRGQGCGWTLEPQELKRFVSVDELNSFILAVRPLVEVRQEALKCSSQMSAQMV